MELHPILEAGDKPLHNLWYVLSSRDPPCPRVGQACLCDDESRSFFVIGGADPSQTYADAYRMNLANQQWTKLTLDKFHERYEHCAFLPSSSSHKIYVFGGANQTENLNSIQLIDTELNTCSSVDCSGALPEPRTMHSAASIGDLLYVWSGGHKGATPISDSQLHLFNCADETWSQPNVKGKLPSARHGHVMVAVGSHVYIHGGMSGPTFHKDLHEINTSDYVCQKVKFRGSAPSSRAAHAGCAHDKRVYVFGGVSAEGALDDMHCFNTVNKTWIKINFDCPPPTPRLDHSMIFAYLPCIRKKADEATHSDDSQSPAPSNRSSEISSSPSTTEPNIIPVDTWISSADGGDSVVATAEEMNNLQLDSLATDLVPVCIVFGGMDTSGNLFNDVLVYRVDSSDAS